MASELTGAGRRGELVAHFQPQQDLHTDRIVGAEALARWAHPELGVILPDTFIPIAEAAGTIHEVGEFMLEQTCRQAAEWRQRSLVLDVSVNVSPLQLQDERFVQKAIDTVRRYGLTPETITLEVTEAEPIVDLPRAVAALERVRAVGMGVSIDDFGAGHSSLEQLRNLPATELKIDQSLIRRSAVLARLLLPAIVAEARDEHLRVVAEGVETAEHLQLARDLGCDRAQGFFIGEPMPATALEALIA